MAFTRFKYDESRTTKQLQQSTDPGRWVMNMPGNGSAPHFVEDPNIRIQTWGANLRTNAIDLEGELRGSNRRLGKDCLGKDNYQKFQVNSEPIQYPTTKALTTEQSRAIAPAWMVRDVAQTDRHYPIFDPQENVCLPFNNNLSTRILEKDYYTPKRDTMIHETKNSIDPSHDLIR